MLKQKFKTLSLRLLLAIVAIMALPDVAHADFYLMGNVSGGGSWEDATSSNKFETAGTSTDGYEQYKLSLDVLSGEFKIYNDAWNNKWTGVNHTNAITLKTDFQLATNGEGGNNIKTSQAFYDVTVYLKMSTPMMLYIDGTTTAPSVDYSSLTYRECEYTVFFDNTSTSWTTVKAYVWDGTGNNVWSGQVMEKVEGSTNLYKWVGTGDWADRKPNNIIFNNGSDSQTNDLVYVNGGIYTKSDKVGQATAVSCKELTGVALTGLDGVSVGEASVSGDVYTWSFTYSGEELAATVNVNETYDNGDVENATEAKTETFYNGSDYKITYNVETNELTITPTHKFLSVKCSLFENAASVAPYSWTYNQTKATETGVALTFTENWTNGSTDYLLENVTFTEGSAYSITYDAVNHKGAVEETSKLTLESIKIAGIADAVLTNNEGVYSYEYTAAANGFTDFNFVTVNTNTEIGYNVDRYIGYTDVATATKAGVGYTEYAELDNKSFNYEFVQGAEYTIVLDTVNGLVKVIVALDSVEIDLAEAVDNGDGTWTYTHTGATAKTTVTFTNVYADASEEEAGSVTHTFVEGGVYIISYNNGSPKVTVVSEPKPVWSEVRIIGDISELGDWASTDGTIITDDNADGIYEYNFTYDSSFHTGTYFAYCIKMSSGNDAHYLYAVDANGKDLSVSAQSYQELTSNGTHSFTYPFVNTGVYKVILNTNTQKVSVQVVSEPAPYNVYLFGGGYSGLSDANHTTTDMSNGKLMNYVGNNIFSYVFEAPTSLIWPKFFIDGKYYATNDGNSINMVADTKYQMYDKSSGGAYNTFNIPYEEACASVTLYVNGSTKQVWFTREVDASYKSGIPVYPLGVATEGELASYDFANNPVYYLCSPVLNDNRISPEWQMEKEEDGKFWIRGFAMRNTNARDNGDYLEEGKIKVVQFTSAAQEEGTECVKISYNDTGDSNPWSEGRLYDACYDPEANTLTLTKVVDRMPFISMVGYNFQQIENYTTPRKSATSHGWQEAWILYDENGEIVKDRNGKVLYSTMWPPKNPVYFNAVKGTESIELSSNNLTFSAAEDYAVKTGATWESELQGADAEAYAGLNLTDGTEYIRYKIDYMWILGATKIWTGWGGQTASWGSQWDNHMNWGYGTDTGNESGAAITSQKSYTLAQNAGNFMVAEPTYYQTVEFFYNVTSPSSSVFYTTLAHGNPSIRAKATADYHGNYDIAIKDADSKTITAYTVTRYNAVTDEVDTANGDNGAVKNETGSWTADDFNNESWVDDKELVNGKYYYKLDITFTDANGSKEVTVYSNPFTIYRPKDHQTEVKVLQLLEVQDNEYVTVPLTAEGQLDKTVLIESVKVAANGEITVSTVADQVDAISAIENGNYQWTMKVLLRSEVPATWTAEMEDTAADTMQDGDVTNWNLTVNGTEVIKVTPNANDNMLYIYDHSVPSTNSYKVTMDYTYNLNDVAGAKATIGKETAFTLNAPQAIAGQKELSVARGSDATIEGNVIPQNGTNMVKLSAVEEEFVNPFFQPMDKDKGKVQTEIEETNLQSADTYEQVDVTFNFTMPSISEEVYDKCVVAYMPKLTAYKGGAIVQQKYLSLIKDTEYSFAPKAIRVTGIDPTWEEVELSIATQYYDKADMSSFVEGRFGTAPVMEQAVSFEANEILSVNGVVWQYERMKRKEQEGQHYIGTGKFDLGVSNVTASFSSEKALVSGIEVEAPAYYNLGVAHNGNTFASPYVFDGEGHDLGVLWAELETKPSGSVTLEVRPLYFFETINGMELESTGLAEFDPAATPAVAAAGDARTFVALYGKLNTAEISNIQTSVEEAVIGGAVVKAGQGYIEVIGAETSSVYSVSGAMVGNGESRYDVVPGVYVVIADGKAVKVVVR